MPKAKSRDNALALPTDVQLIEALWRLIPQHKPDRITVKMIVDEAGCSRGTFYYYFEDITSLLKQALQNEVLLSKSVPRMFQTLLFGKPENLTDLTNDFHLQRLQLAAQQGAYRQVLLALDAACFSTWHHLLAPNEELLSNDAKFALTFFSAGMREVIGPQLDCPTLIECDVPLSFNYAKRILESTVQLASEAQGISEGLVKQRLEALCYTSPMTMLA